MIIPRFPDIKILFYNPYAIQYNRFRKNFAALLKEVIMQYKIGDVSRILGISTDLLRYYEKKGVVTPTKDKQNDYRYYDAWDINFLIDCLWFKGFGFGIPQIAYMVSDCCYMDLVPILEEKRDEIMESIHQQELILHRLSQHCEQVMRVRNMLGKCEIMPCPEVVCYLNRYDTAYDNSPQMQKLSKQWLQYMPFLSRYFEMPSEAGGGYAHRYAWGFSLGMEYVSELSVPVIPPVKHQPSVECIHSTFKSSGKNAFSHEHIKYLFDYASDNGYTVAGDARGNLVCSILENGTNTGYFEVWLPVSKDAG